MTTTSLPCTKGLQRLLCLHCDCELRTVNFTMAARSCLTTMPGSSLAGGGILPSSRRHWQTIAPASRLPANPMVTKGTKRRCPPGFPLSTLAEVSPISH